MRSLSIVVMSQIKLIPTPSWLVYFVFAIDGKYVTVTLTFSTFAIAKSKISKFWTNSNENEILR